MAKRKTSYLLLSVVAVSLKKKACGGDETGSTGIPVSCEGGACAGATSAGGAQHPPGVVVMPGTGGRILGVVPVPVGTGGTSAGGAGGTGGVHPPGVVPIPPGSGGTSAGGAGGTGGATSNSGGVGGVPPGLVPYPGTGGRHVIGVVPVPPGTGGIPFPGIIIRPPDGGP